MSLIDEIREQPDVLERLLFARPDVERVADIIRQRRIRRVMVAARGSSRNAALLGAWWWPVVAGIAVETVPLSLFTLYDATLPLADTLVLGVSQSGRSPDVIRALEMARAQQALTLAITNEQTSPLAAIADHVLDLRAGAERAVAATKTYTAQLLLVAMLGAALAQDERLWHELARVPALVAEALQREDEMRTLAERYRFISRCFVLGRGLAFGATAEWALKLQELTYVQAQAFSVADFQHGPKAMLERDVPVFVLALRGAAWASTHDFVRFLVQETDADVLVFSNVPETTSLAHCAVTLPDVPEHLGLFPAIVLAQLFTYALTRTRHLDTEQPRFLSKVTETF